MKKKTDRGFSLIELIIAIAILIILTGLLAPQFMKYIEKSRKAACLNNVDVMIKEYQVAMIDNPDITPEEALDMMVKRGMECPSKGEYKILYPKGNKDSFVVNCRVHGNVEGASTDPKVAIGDSVYDEMLKFVKTYTKDEVVKLLKEAGFLDEKDGINNVSNDKIRKYLVQEKYKGQWPEADKEIFKTGDKTLYLQSYIDIYGTDKGLSNATSNNVVAYIGTAKDESYTDRWAAYYIYDKEHNQWYKHPNGGAYRLNDKDWPTIKAATINAKLEKDRWIPVN